MSEASFFYERDGHDARPPLDVSWETEGGAPITFAQEKILDGSL
ncbi:MAG: hypothetical protein RL141_977 [Candidatus Parcubacteria bacterium]|jgi:hypothetical protein